MMLTLPEGTYRITMVGPPPKSESRMVTVQIAANGSAEIAPETFRTMTAEEYFEQYLTSATTLADPAAAGAGAADPGAVQAPGGPAPAPTAPPQGAPR
jgi:hypothetical protein